MNEGFEKLDEDMEQVFTVIRGKSVLVIRKKQKPNKKEEKNE